jgi:hypothetical protein
MNLTLNGQEIDEQYVYDKHGKEVKLSVLLEEARQEGIKYAAINWRFAIAHLNKAERDSVIATYETLIDRKGTTV